MGSGRAECELACNYGMYLIKMNVIWSYLLSINPFYTYTTCFVKIGIYIPQSIHMYSSFPLP
jgi:hypothetical protein